MELSIEHNLPTNQKFSKRVDAIGIHTISDSHHQYSHTISIRHENKKFWTSYDTVELSWPWIIWYNREAPHVEHVLWPMTNPLKITQSLADMK